ncbi:3-ketoacyl-reductase [Colletotrichum musicola]|uniref:Very-long-chain 3-oxoacyl-CoA reductase n=1 Tax=Colletotrichum musicola TaxID=2175873 RepID=A0A8H6K0S8_9PEZI|nr:3-ketoacyl-reductase [Colletotrichum musicola]
MFSVTDYIGNLPQPVQLVLASVGALFLTSKALSYVKFLLGVFVLSGTSLRKYGRPGTWAVVTGASDGLGKEYAYQLASKGFNLVLVSRTQSKLETLAHELEAKFSGKVQVKVLAMDFARDDNADYDRLAQLIDGLDVGILINNVGHSHSIPVPFLLTERTELQNIITINCLGTLKTTQVVAPILQKRKKGLILTMGSFAGWIPTPYLATYSGSKAFLQHWSSSLAAELKGDGVDVQLVVSYLITTAMSKIRRASVTIPNPRNFVRAALSKVGTGIYQNFSYTYTPWWTHALMLWVVENTIGVAHEWALAFNLKMHADIRNRALRKAAREAKKN